MTMPTTATRVRPRPASGWPILIAGEHEIEQLYTPDQDLPRFKVALRPDDQDRMLLYDQGQLLGVLMGSVDVVDYTHHSGRLAWWELTYNPEAI